MGGFVSSNNKEEDKNDENKFNGCKCKVIQFIHLESYFWNLTFILTVMLLEFISCLFIHFKIYID